MGKQIHSFEEYFSKNTDYEQYTDHHLEYIATHTHDNHSGFLFKHLRDNQALFVRKDQLLNGPPESSQLYRFAGFVDNSSVSLIMKIN
ncbi:MAG: hypothetical protein WCG20_00580 [bacterium]